MYVHIVILMGTYIEISRISIYFLRVINLLPDRK